jgi:hypothetical protein
VTITLGQTAAGRFAGSFIAATSGVYTAFTHARGVTWEGQNFQREQRLTAVVFPGGNNPAPGPTGESPLCELLRCLLSGDVLKETEMVGINTAALRKCLAETCRADTSQLGGEQPYDPAATAPVSAMQAVDPAQLRATVLEVQQEIAAQAGQIAELVQAQPIEPPATEPMIKNFGIDLDTPAGGGTPTPPARRRDRGSSS